MDFESMLRDRELRSNIKNSNNYKSGIKKADKGATLFDLIKMIDALVKITMKDVEFIPDEKKKQELDVMNPINKSMITYSVISRIPKFEKKPVVREEFEEYDEVNKDKILGTTYGQKFSCSVQFDIISSVYSEAEEVMNNFEELMFKYAGFFKRNGVAEIIFEKHETDSSYDNLRETHSVRSLIYYVEIEKLIVVFQDEIKEIELLAQEYIEK